jgi:signal transduction histidine kinase/ABC-type uncharacterized transport system substrate-binding protein
MVYQIKQFVLISFFLILALSSASADEKATQDILILHSFHKGHIWNDSISNGIDNIIIQKSKPGITTNLYYEYMDTERVHGSMYTLTLYEFLRKKYSNSRFDVIIATDDSAFRFLMDYQKKIFPDTPVVFCGVNYFEEFEMFGHELFTGVVESIDIRQTVETALSLHPETKNILVVVDRTDTSIATIKTFIQTFKHFKDPSMFKFIKAQSFVELQGTLASLSHDTIVLFVNFTVDRNGQKISMREGLSQITKKCSVPIYSFWDNYLGNGILGGKMASGSAHGRKAAEIALRILSGDPVSSIPVFKESLNQHLFDFEQMQRFEINKDDLPAGSQIINVPFSFYHTYKKLVWAITASIAGLSLIILVLVLNTFKRKRVEKSLKHFTNQLHLLHKIDRAILAGKFSHKITWEVLEYVRDLNDSHWASVVLFDFRKKTGTLDAVDSDTGNLSQEGIAYPIDEFSPDDLNNGKSIVFNCKEFPENSFFSDILSKHGVDCFTSIPLISNNNLIGALNLSANSHSATNFKTFDIIEEVAASLAVAIQSVRFQRAGNRYQKELERLSAKVFEMQESTCRKISFELHDEIGQSLTAATINLTAIEKLIKPGVAERIPGLVTDTKNIVNHLSDQTHDLSLNLWPPMLRDFGLEPTLDWYLERISEKVNIELVFDGSDFIERPAEEIETALYRLSQEALNNVLKHAKATRVDISITRKENGWIFFMVEDNGIGFDLETTLSDEKMNDRLGILGMRERISILGGKLNIWSARNKGTRVSADIPWKEKIEHD